MCLYLVHFPEPYLSASCSSFLVANICVRSNAEAVLRTSDLADRLLTVHPWPSVVFRSTCPPPSAGRWAGLANPSSQTPVLASGRLSPKHRLLGDRRGERGQSWEGLPPSPGGIAFRGCISVILLAPTRQPSHCISPPVLPQPPSPRTVSSSRLEHPP